MTLDAALKQHQLEQRNGAAAAVAEATEVTAVGQPSVEENFRWVRWVELGLGLRGKLTRSGGQGQQAESRGGGQPGKGGGKGGGWQVAGEVG